LESRVIARRPYLRGECGLGLPVSRSPPPVSGFLRPLPRHKNLWYKPHIMADEPTFEWDAAKDSANRAKHGVAFALAQMAFFDPRRVIAEDLDHSADEPRYFCFGIVGGGVMTVRFTWRESLAGRHIRIFGAGYWRKGKTIYEQQNG
jgi:uncharacterized DUF497 family protein